VELGPLVATGREAEVYAWADEGVSVDPLGDPDGGAATAGGPGPTVVKLLRDPDHGVRVEREAAALRALADVGYPAPRAIRTVTIDGRPGLVLERIDATDQLELLGRRPLSVFRAGHVLGTVHAAMHDCVAPPSLPALHDELRARITAAEPLPDDLRAQTLELLDGLPGGDRLCHGDLHPANILGDWDHPVVIDWADATGGDPVADVARTVVLLTVGIPPGPAPWTVRALGRIGRRIFRDRYLATYRGRRTVDDDLLRPWIAVRAAARLNEPVPDEHPGVLELLRATLSD
jgi:aminoglycoside phosphotransferase (APT) family kinase protein